MDSEASTSGSTAGELVHCGELCLNYRTSGDFCPFAIENVL